MGACNVFWAGLAIAYDGSHFLFSATWTAIFMTQDLDTYLPRRCESSRVEAIAWGPAEEQGLQEQGACRSALTAWA
jgi:hypothetical protein